jgi:asparagine synthase (glutamine-hydrolysing)
MQQQCYWSWNDIKPLRGRIDQCEIIEELGRLFIGAVKQRTSENRKCGLALSGGLDSRAILAAMPEGSYPIHAFTFGTRSCDDIRYAKEAAKKKKAIHHIFYINEKNWLDGRTEGVWWTDGHCNLLHMHNLAIIRELKKYYDIHLNGFLGDAVLGGTYMKLHQDWSMAETLDNRGRQFMGNGLRRIDIFVANRNPFFDNKLIEFAHTIPEKLRANHYIYCKMLLNEFPDYYIHIPWQKTGYPISYSKARMRLVRFKNRVVNKLKRESKRLGFNFRDLRNYTDYQTWIRKEPARSFFEELLLSKKAIYPEYIDRNKVQCYFRNHMEEKANYANELCLALTFELWLQQVFNKQYI